jgi:hypothetical protein
MAAALVAAKTAQELVFMDRPLEVFFYEPKV